MTFLRTKSLGEEVYGRAQRLAGTVTGNPPREALGALRQYAGRAGGLTTQALTSAGRQVRRRPGLSIAVGATLGIGAIAAAWLILRERARVRPEDDEHNPTRQRATNDSGDALDGSGEDNPLPGESRAY